MLSSGILHMKSIQGVNMKKIVIYISLILMLMSVFTGCTSSEPDKPEEPVPVEKLSIEAYLQSEANTKYIYEGEGMEFAAYTSWVDYESDGLLQLRSNNGGTEAVKVYKVEDAKLVMVFTQGETYHRENMLEKEPNMDEVLLMEPLEKGTAWTLQNGAERSITDVAASVETPSGTYTAIEVTTVNEDSKTLDYYAKGTGLVKSVFIGAENYEVSSTLSMIEKNSRLIQSLRLYYPNIEDEKYYYKDVVLEFETNDSAEDLISEAYKENETETAGVVLTENATINRLWLDQEAMVVHLDLNREFLTEMNAGSYYEYMILQSLVNTVGNYCMSDRVSITLDGYAYESGHILLEDGDYLTVDLGNVVDAG